MSSAELLQKAAVDLAAHIRETKPYLFTIDQAIDKTEDGIVDIQVRVYHGEVTDIVVARSERYTFKKNK